MAARKVILKKTGEVGALTLLSKLLGIVREFVMARYLGAGDLSDAFNAAYAIPNSLRKIFAEGALSAAFVPSLTQELRSGGRKAIKTATPNDTTTEAPITTRILRLR